MGETAVFALAYKCNREMLLNRERVQQYQYLLISRQFSAGNQHVKDDTEIIGSNLQKLPGGLNALRSASGEEVPAWVPPLFQWSERRSS